MGLLRKCKKRKAEVRVVDQYSNGKVVVDVDGVNHLRSFHGAAKLACKKGNCTVTFVFSTHFYQHMKKQH